MKLLAWTFLLCGLCYAQELTVRVVNAKDLQPLARQTVVVQYLTSQSVSGPLRLQTDDHGEARFGLPSPLPANVDIRVVLTSERWRCACWATVETAKVLSDGLLQSAPGNNAKAAKPIQPRPREVVIMARPFTFGEKVLYPFVKQ